MCKSKDKYINTYKRILIQLLPLSLFLFANCNTKLDFAPIPVNAEPAQPPIIQTYTPTIAYGEEEKKISSSRKRKRTVLSDEGKIGQGPVLKKIEQEYYLEQGEEGFAKLPIELQVYILSLLGGKDFHRASLVCQSWREAAFIAEEGKTLDLSRRKLGQKDCQVLLKVPFTSLVLAACKLGHKQSHILSQSTRIKHLDLSWNKIGDAGAQALSSGNLSVLTSLDLDNNRIGNKGAQALANGNFSALTSLDLNNNRIGNKGAWALSSGNLSTLTFLNLFKNQIGTTGVEALASGNLSALTSLILGCNEIGTEEAQALASGNLSALTSLDLNNNRIGNKGAQALANGNLSALTSLDLYGNRIGNKGVRALASGNLSALTSLDLYGNNIEDEGKKALETWATKKFIKLYF